MHCGIGGGHYAGETTTRKIWQSGLWWPTTQKDTNYIVDNATRAREWDNLSNVPACCVNQLCLWNLSKNGVLISSAHSNRRWHKPEIITSWLPSTTALNGSKQRHYVTIRRHQRWSFGTIIFGADSNAPLSLLAIKGLILSIKWYRNSWSTIRWYTRKAPLITLRKTGSPNRQIRRFKTSWKRLSTKTERIGIRSCKAPCGTTKQVLKQVSSGHLSD